MSLLFDALAMATFDLALAFKAVWAVREATVELLPV
jgi:hypothetical protein